MKLIKLSIMYIKKSFDKNVYNSIQKKRLKILDLLKNFGNFTPQL